MSPRSSVAKDVVKYFTVILVALALVGLGSSHWVETLYLDGVVHTGSFGRCIEIRKILEGSFTDPETGELLESPTSKIAVAADFPTVFTLTIEVVNCKSAALGNVKVTDIIKNNVAPGDLDESGTYDYETNRPDSTVTWEEWGNHQPGKKDPKDNMFGFQKLTWNVGELQGGEVAWLKIWIVTLRNPAGKYEPTSGDEGDSQPIEINEGATVVARHDFGVLVATSPAITITITDDGVMDNGLGLIKPEPPYITDWSRATYP